MHSLGLLLRHGRPIGISDVGQVYTEPSKLGRWTVIWIILQEEEVAGGAKDGGKKKREKSDILELVTIQANPILSPSLVRKFTYIKIIYLYIRYIYY